MPKFVIRAPRYVGHIRHNAAPNQPVIVEIHKKYLVNVHAVDKQGKPAPRDFTKEELLAQGLEPYLGGEVSVPELKQHFASVPPGQEGSDQDGAEEEAEPKKGRASDKEL